MTKYVPDYFAKDFTTIREELITRLPVLSGGQITDLNESSVMVTLIEMFAGLTDMLGYYLDKQALETYLPTVRQPRNVYRLAKLIGYVIRETTSSKVEVKFTIPSAHTTEVIIPKDTRLATTSSASGGSAGLFYTTEPTVIPVGNTESEGVLAIQGTKTTESFTMTGDASPTISLAAASIDPATVAIQTGSIVWTAQESFLYSQADDYHFVVTTTFDGTTHVTFGDGKFGRAPVSGEQIQAIYMVSSGANGNVGAEAVGLVLDTIYDAQGNQYTGVTVSNEAAASGGSARQSLDQVKATAPGALSGLYRAMTKYDYIALVQRQGGVLHVNVWGEQEEDPPSYENMNWVNIVVCPEGGGLPSENMKTVIREYLDTVQPITVRQRYIDPSYVNVKVALDVYVDVGYTVEKVRTAVSSAIRSYFQLENVRFGLDIRVSEVYKRAMAVAGVSYVTVTKVVKTDSQGVESGGPVNDIVCQKWEIPQLYTIDVTGYRASEQPSPDLYPYETV